MSDPEIVALNTISCALEPLDEFARNRVLRYAQDRYGLNIEQVVERFEKRDRGQAAERAVPAP